MNHDPEQETLAQRLDRLDAERLAADAAYNNALTALDQAALRPADLPHPPPPLDDAKVTALNDSWNILPSGPPPMDRSLKGRLRGLIWRIVGPPLEAQRAFNAALVEHVNRNIAPQREFERAIASTIALVGDKLADQLQFQSRLIQYLQTMTLYVDTKDRSAEGGIHVLNLAVDALNDGWMKRWESLGAREQRMNARVASIDDLRGALALAQQTTMSLKREVERLLAGPAPAGPSATPASSAAAPDLDAYKYLGFEDAFRGSRDAIRDGLAGYVPLFAGASDVLDLGCGRGEFLGLLRDAGIGARGLDLNHEMVETSRARGFDVHEGDALAYLSTLPDASLGGLFAAQVAEHLEPAYLMRLIETAWHKLRPGSVIVLETINPACWAAFFESYIRDLTHVRPLHPETLQYLLRVSGFHDVTVQFSAPISEQARLQPVAVTGGNMTPLLVDLVGAFNDNVEKLNARMFTFQDYAAIGRR